MDDGFVACKGMASPGVSIGSSSKEVVDGFACREGLGAGGSVGFSRKWEIDNGEGVARSRVNAAQSQWVDRAP